MGMRKISYLQAINEALREELRRDPKVFMMGEDIQFGVFGHAVELFDEFGPERVRNTPISEAGFVGAGIGAAACGMRPIVDIMFGNFMYVAMDQLANQAAKLRYMSGGQVSFPIVFHVLIGAMGSVAAQHSDHPVAPFANTPGLKIVLPSTPYDAKGLMKSAIRSDDPVIFFTEVALGWLMDQVPEEEYLVPIGKGEVKREGTDVTVVAVGCTLPQALSAAEELEREGISVEVVDPRTIVPLDRDVILNSARKTGRVVVSEDAPRFCSFASEISAIVSEELFSHLRAPVKRVTREHLPVPFSQPMERFILPNEEKIASAVRATLS
jgi:pyruvate dehydrogenase E1 component beta subunit